MRRGTARPLKTCRPLWRLRQAPRNDRPSLTGALKENAGKVKSQPVKAAAAKDGPSRRCRRTKKYGIIYADPPWRYDMKRGHGAAENHYPTMSIEEICALPVADLAAKDSALFLWGYISRSLKKRSAS